MNAESQQIAQLQRTLGELDRQFTELNSRLENAASSITPNWEYRVEHDIDVSVMNALGQQGWELVSSVSYTLGFGLVINGVGGERDTVHIQHTFKRPSFKANNPVLEPILKQMGQIEAEKSRVIEALSVQQGTAGAMHYFDRPGSMSIGEYQEKLMEACGIGHKHNGYEFRGKCYSSFGEVQAAVKAIYLTMKA